MTATLLTVFRKGTHHIGAALIWRIVTYDRRTEFRRIPRRTRTLRFLCCTCRCSSTDRSARNPVPTIHRGTLKKWEKQRLRTRQPQRHFSWKHQSVFLSASEAFFVSSSLASAEMSAERRTVQLRQWATPPCNRCGCFLFIQLNTKDTEHKWLRHRSFGRKFFSTVTF